MSDAIVVSDVFCLHPLPGGSNVAALRGLSLRVAAGERLVVHGPNGSGKTTLLRVLSGDTAASAGSVRVGEVDLVGASPGRVVGLRRDTLGLVDQHSGRALRSELSVLDNIALQLRLAGRPRRPALETARAALAGLGLEHFAGRHPHTLSAGEAQRVAVCAAVAHGPRVVLADEPTGELDVDAADAVYDLLARAAGRTDATLLLVTHDPRAARIADRMVRIRDGRLSEQWRPSAPQDEELVVDDRGWLRVPEPARRRAGMRDRARVSERDGAIVLGATPTPWPSRPVPRLPPLADELLPTAAELAQAEGVRVAHGDRVVLDGITVDVRAGRLTVLRGRSGSGKSTLLRVLLGLADPDSGGVRLAGRSMTGLGRAGRAALRRDVAAVALQGGALAESLDVLENLALARTARGLPRDADAVHDTAAALDLLALTGRPVRVLSGGERQRVGVARSLVVQRPLVVLDEPTSHQDEAHAELLTAVLVAAAAAGAGVLCATHDPVLADAAADLIVLDRLT